jgi:hypothetical protein
LHAAIRPVRWLLIVRVRLQPMELHMDKTKWTRRWKTWVAPTKLPGIFKRKEGGHLVRARVLDPTTGKRREIRKVLPEADEATAYKWLNDERSRASAGLFLAKPQRPRFADYGVSLLDRKVAQREIKSARSNERWEITLDHLILGVGGAPGFGELLIDQIRVTHVRPGRRASRG